MTVTVTEKSLVVYVGFDFSSFNVVIVTYCKCLQREVLPEAATGGH